MGGKRLRKKERWKEIKMEGKVGKVEKVKRGKDESKMQPRRMETRKKLYMCKKTDNKGMTGYIWRQGKK